MGGNGPSTQCSVDASEEDDALQIKEVLRLTPRKRQTLLFSATMTEEVRDLAALSLQRPVRLAADAAGAAPKTLQQEIVRLKVPSCIYTHGHIQWECLGIWLLPSCSTLCAGRPARTALLLCGDCRKDHDSQAHFAETLSIRSLQAASEALQAIRVCVC